MRPEKRRVSRLAGRRHDGRVAGLACSYPIDPPHRYNTQTLLLSLGASKDIMKLVGTLLLLGGAAQCWARAGPQLQEPLHAEKHHLSLTHDLIAFHKNLTQIESITGNEKGVGEWLVSSLLSQGYNVEKQYVEKKPARFNVLAWPGKERDAKVLLSSHIDTVRPYNRRMQRAVAESTVGPTFLPIQTQQQQNQQDDPRPWQRRRQRLGRHPDHCGQQAPLFRSDQLR